MIIPERINLLFIEDDETSANIITKLLETNEHIKFNIVRKKDLASSLKFIEEECLPCRDINDCNIDVILLDIVLPNSHGVQTYVKVHETCDFLPVVIISGYEDIACKCVKLGAQDFLIKPEISAGVITRSLKYAIERKKLELRKRTVEKELKKQHEQLIAMFDGMDEIIYVADPDTYEILYSNKALNKVFGGHVGEKCYVAFQGYDKPCSFCSNDKIFGKNLGKTHIWELRNTLNHRWYRCIDRAIQWPNGKMVRFELAIDITEIKETEKLLKESERKYRNLVEVTKAGIYEIDFRTNKFIYVNDVGFI
jgi:FixJ family two-component response regulator